MKQIIAFTLICWSVIGYGQQDFQFSQTLSNPYLFNPAASGTSNVGEINIGNRMQFMQVEGKPMTSYLTFSSGFRTGKQRHALNELATGGKTVFNAPNRVLGSKHVAGIRLFNDQIGPFTRNAVMASYAYHLPLTKQFNMGVGLGFGWNNFGIDQSKLILGSSGDVTFQTYFANTSIQNRVDANTGITIYNEKLLIGVSTTQLFGSAIRFQDVTTSSTHLSHLYLIAAYRFEMNSTYGIEPIIQMKRVKGSPMSYDIGARIHYNRMGWVALAYRNSGNLSLGAGVNLYRHFRIAYNFDAGLGATRHFGSGAHELQIGYIFGYRRNMEKELKDQEKEEEKKNGSEDLETQPGTGNQ
jgi:type IX secretion system PorP/SprF family membrane protein